jgi:hypothetical protein
MPGYCFVNAAFTAAGTFDASNFWAQAEKPIAATNADIIINFFIFKLFNFKL